MELSTTPRTWPNGSGAWFVCRAAGHVTDITVPMKDGVTASEADLAKQGRMKAAQRFKRLHELHPCTKVECEFQGVEQEEQA
jgi:hypothetical protein